MKKKTLFFVIAVVCIIATAAMYFIGKGSSHLSELYDVFWIPIPLGLVALGAAVVLKN